MGKSTHGYGGFRFRLQRVDLKSPSIKTRSARTQPVEVLVLPLFAKVQKLKSPGKNKTKQILEKQKEQTEKLYIFCAEQEFSE